MSLLDKEAVKRAENTIKNFDKKLSIIVLESSARTARDAAKALNCEVGAIVKSLLFRAEDNFFLCLVSGDKKCSLRKLKEITGKKDLCMASPEEVKSHTGYTIGGVSPVGHLSSLKIFLDNSLNRFIDLYAAAGHPNCVFKIDYENLKKITKSEVKEITE